MTETMTIEPDRWSQFFDQLTKDHEGDLITVEVIDESLGDQVEGELLPFALATFDPSNDMIIISASGKTERDRVLRHMIIHPSSVDVASPQPDQTVLRVVAPSTTTLTHFHPRSAPSGSGSTPAS